MGLVGAVASIQIFGIFFHIKILEILTIVILIENPTKNYN